MQNKITTQIRMPAEWEAQSAVMLSLPTEDTDWAYMLDRVHDTYARIIAAITRFEKVLLVCPDLPRGRAFLKKYSLNAENILLHCVPINDTWTRDYGPITVMKNGRAHLLDFMFNGWGLKFAADRDNLVTTKLFEKKVFKTSVGLERAPLVFEGGSVESDGEGTLLVTSRCLLSPNRNPWLSKEQIEAVLCGSLGAKRVLWLDQGELMGDDTDAHIDTLARLAPNDTIIYESAGLLDAHYISLKRMELELKRFKTASSKKYYLVKLPLPSACFDDEGLRLPATYANYLVINKAVLVPTYNDAKNDARALEAIGGVFTDREIIPIDCRSLIQQHGSLHCVTMQLPQGVI